MKKTLIALFSVLATVAIAETDYLALPRIEAIVSGEELVPLLNATDVTVADDVTVGDDLTVAGAINATEMFKVYTGVGSTNVQLSAVTPVAKGQFAYAAATLLSALTGAGTTGTLAVAKGTTTNDWIIVK